MAQVEIFGPTLSTYVRTARMVAHEKGIEHTLNPATPHSSEILALNPFGKVPALRHGAVVLFETQAIAHYLDEAFTGLPLQPEGVVERAHMEMWISVVNTALYPALIGRYVMPYVMAWRKDTQPDRAVIEAALPEVGRQLTIVEGMLDGRTWLVGERLTLADLFLHPVLLTLTKLPEGPALLAERPGIGRAMAAMAERPAFQAVAGTKKD